MENCIFCKIVSHEIPSFEVYSDDKCVVLLDINPVNEGHCIILPKKHYQILPQLPEDLIQHIFLMAKRTSKALLRALSLKGTSIFIANGVVAGQKAPHFMLHVIPRKEGDALFKMPKNNIDPKELDFLHKKVISLFNPSDNNGVNNSSHKTDIKNKNDKEENKNEDKIDLDKISKLF